MEGQTMATLGLASARRVVRTATITLALAGTLAGPLAPRPVHATSVLTCTISVDGYSLTDPNTHALEVVYAGSTSCTGPDLMQYMFGYADLRNYAGTFEIEQAPGHACWTCSSTSSYRIHTMAVGEYPLYHLYYTLQMTQPPNYVWSSYPSGCDIVGDIVCTFDGGTFVYGQTTNRTYTVTATL
jgi:hypothetical protein